MRKQVVYGLLALTLLLGMVGVLYGEGGDTAVFPPPSAPPNPTALAHPSFPLLDTNGNNVLNSGEAVSTMQTCGSCHDTTFIAQHSFHADLGLASIGQTSPDQTMRAWDTSLGHFGRWDPLTYRYLSPDGDDQTDQTTPDWLMNFTRHVGGGPAQTSRNGQPLTSLTPDPTNPETSIINPTTGQATAWDWQESGVVEMNCFLCHTPNPNNSARIEQLQTGNFGWANSATLLGTGIITQTAGGLQWLPAAFADNGELRREMVPVQDPTNSNCAQCHGEIHDNIDDPLLVVSGDATAWRTLTTGQIISPQRISDSAMNVSDKGNLSRAFDIHAERVVNCTDCHYALNNPIYTQTDPNNDLSHLTFDPRRLDYDAFLYRPLHQFAKGSSAQSTLALELNDTMRTCTSCHEAIGNDTHAWLPFAERHMQVLACETCHIPQLYGSAQQTIDWTAIRADGSPLQEFRGIEGDPTLPSSLITGYTPVLLPRQNSQGESVIAPHNLITAFYWVYEQSDGQPRPVAERDLQAAYLTSEGEYHPELLALFDSNNDGRLVDNELRLDNAEKVSLIEQNLQALGLKNPTIQGDVQPYNINHTVTNGAFATQDCQECHANSSRVTAPLVLASYAPGGVIPSLLATETSGFSGSVSQDAQGVLRYAPNTANLNIYVIGYDRVTWVNVLGAGLFVLTLLGIFLHGTLRFVGNKKHPHAGGKLERVYMYTFYERFWHWLQTAAILLLLFTGLIIHKPELFGFFSFPYVVQVHNLLGFILVVNAGLSLFYHLASGEIRQYLPKPVGFFDQAIEQAKFYLQGIFRNEPHPFEKTADRKLNPLQQMTYLAILNVLLPLQIITGILMWGVQRWPEVATAVGGLRFLNPFHTLIAWLFATFIVLHVYLTTTGHKPTAGIEAMMFGWDEVEQHGSAHAPATSTNEEITHP